MLIELVGVNYMYMPGTPFARKALRNISLQIAEGEFTSIIGPTGSGKSTLVQQFNGLLQPTEGKIFLDGREVGQKGLGISALRRNVGLIFQFSEHQLFEERVYDDVAFGPRNFGCAEDEVNHRVRDSLRVVGLDYKLFEERSPFSLSGGEMKRVAIAGVLAMEPKILILDEPASGLDSVGRVEIMERLVQLHHQKRLTIILVSHDMNEVSTLSDRVIVLNKGQIVFDDSPKHVFLETERLLEIGLDIPQITALLTSLKSKGINVPVDIFKAEEAEEAILKWINEKKGINGV